MGLVRRQVAALAVARPEVLADLAPQSDGRGEGEAEVITLLMLAAWLGCGAGACVQIYRQNGGLETCALAVLMGPAFLLPLLLANKLADGRVWLPPGWGDTMWAELRSARVEDPLMLEANEEVERFMREEL